MLAVVLQNSSNLPTDFASLTRWSWQPGELQRCKRIAHDGRRLQFLAGRYLARQLLADQLGGSPFDWPLCGAAGQAPDVPSHPGLHVSISHSGPWLACALADRPVGVDVQTHKPGRDLLGIAALAFDSSQCAQLARLDPMQLKWLFALHWTLREAWLKRAGCGLDLPLMRALHVQPASLSGGNARVWDLPQGA